MKPDFIIRAARAADDRAMLELERQFPSDRMSLRSIRRFLRTPSAQVWMASAASTVAGSLILLTRRGSGMARIYSVVVSPAYRGRGLGARLVQRAERWARQQGCQWMSLEVRADNAAARALYAGLGYAEHAALVAYYDDGADGLRLRKRLQKHG